MRKINRGERGIALFVALFALLLLSSVALGLMFMANTETAVNRNYRGTTQAFFAAQAGTQEGVMRLRQSADAWQITPPSTSPTTSAGTGVTYIINPTGSETVKPWDSADPYADLELCNESFKDGSGNNVLGLASAGYGLKCGSTPSGTYYTTVASKDPNTGTSTAMSYKWVRITQKQNATFSPYTVNGASPANSKVCWDGAHQQTLASLGYADCDKPPTGGMATTPVYVVTALAVTANNSRRMYQVEYAPTPAISVPAAVTSKDTVDLNGNLAVNAFDQCSCNNCTTDKNGVSTCSARYAGGTCDGSKPAIYTGQTVEGENASQTFIAGTGPFVENVSSSAGGWPAAYDVNSLIARLKPGSVNVAHPDGTGGYALNAGVSLGTVPNPFPPSDPANVSTDGQVSYVGGSINLKDGASGSGILIIDGDLRLNGKNFQWYGLILVKGNITMTGGGSPTTNIVGAMLSGETANDDTTLGGSFGINLDLCALQNAFKRQPLTYISSRELLY